MVCQDLSQISTSGQLELAPVQLDNLLEQWIQIKLSKKLNNLLITYGHVQQMHMTYNLCIMNPQACIIGLRLT